MRANPKSAQRGISPSVTEPDWERILGEPLYAEVKQVADACSIREDGAAMTVTEAAIHAAQLWARGDLKRPSDSTAALTDEERIALERIADRNVDGEDYSAVFRIESALQKAVFLLDVLEKVYADGEQKSRLHDQRVSGLIHLSAGLDAELMICFDLMLERVKQLELQRAALLQLSGRKLSARDLQRLNQDEDFQLARRFALRKAAKEEQVAA